MITRLNSNSINATVTYTPLPNNKTPDLNTCLLLHLDEIPFKDSSVYEWSINNYGSPQLTTSYGNPFNVNGKSLYLNGSSSIYINSARFPNLNIDKSFTFEFFIYTVGTNLSNDVVFSRYSDGKGYRFGYVTGSNWGIYSQGNRTDDPINVNVQFPYNSISTGKWHHIACSRFADTFYIFVDGDLKQSYTYNDNRVHSMLTYGSNFVIGGLTTNSYNINCYLSEFRISSLCRYNSNFTPPTEPFSPYVEG